MKRAFLVALVLSIFVVALLSDFSEQHSSEQRSAMVTQAFVRQPQSSKQRPVTKAEAAPDSTDPFSEVKEKYIALLPESVRQMASVHIQDTAGDWKILQLEIDHIPVENTDLRIQLSESGSWEFRSPVLPPLSPPESPFPKSPPEDLLRKFQESNKLSAEAELHFGKVGTVWLARESGLIPALKVEVDQAGPENTSLREMWHVQAETGEVLSKGSRVRY